MKKFAKCTLFGLIAVISVFFVYAFATIPFTDIKNCPSVVNLSYEEMQNVNNNHIFGKFVCLKCNDILSTNNISSNIVNASFKLFNLITIKTIQVNTDEVEVIAGGNIVGFSLNSNGVIVIGSSPVITENGNVNTLEQSDIKSGDVILEIANEKVNRISSIEKIINKPENAGKELEVVVKRKDEQLKVMITPALDMQSKKYKLGVWIKDDVSGVGTLTYIRKDNNRFGALGHAISDTENKKPFEISGGDMYNSTIIGYNKAVKGKPGEIKALFVQGSNSLGKVDKNTKFGVFGTYEESKLIKLAHQETFKTGGRLTAKPGKAKIRVSLDNNAPQDYDIEIIKTNYQNLSSDKSMVIRVTDKELLNKTGGIIQGMSGSPIIQDEKIIGAVTHVFVSDPTKGFGVYLDWMINE